MLLKALEIQGFKSFPDKTTITFDRGLTAVVGPNGSGKSNISDAIRWVMGEQSTKNLRGAKMEDVIFTGTKSRKSQGFAEVSLVIDNRGKTLQIDCDEVVVTRKYYRSGDSEYMINRASVRLKDINELFMDTGLGRDGYAVVGQGRIAEIVQSKSDERREIFEEAAGISKYRYRKTEAERKLRHAEENLLRLRDILSELEERVAPLEEQSEKAKRFLALSEEKKTTEISVWVHTLTQSNIMLKDQRDKILARQLKEEEVLTQLEEKEKEIQSGYDTMQQCMVRMDDLRREKERCEQEIAVFQSGIAVCENDIRHNEENKVRIEQEIDSFDSETSVLTDEIESRKRQLSEKQDLLEELTSEISGTEEALLRYTQETDKYQESADKLGRQINEQIVRISQMELATAQIESRMDGEHTRLQNAGEMIRQRKEDLAACHKELGNAESLLKRLGEKEESLNNAREGYQMKLSYRRSQHGEIAKQKDRLDLKIKEKLQKARLLEDLEKNYEGFAYSVKAVLKQGKRGTLSGVLGTVSQLLEVENEYSTAVEIALGGMLQHVVVENEAAAKSAIRFLKRENAGRATFLPVTSVRGKRLDTTAFEDAEGFIALACDLVAYDKEYEGVVYSMLGRIAVVDDLDTAVLIAKKNGYRFKIVTLDGQVVNAGGSMSGGSNRGKSQGILSRKSDIQHLHTDAETLEAQMGQVSAEAAALEEEITGLKAQVNAVASELITLGEDRIRGEAERKRLEQLIQSETDAVRAMEQELEQADVLMGARKEELSSIAGERKAAEELLAQLRESLADTQGVQSETDESRMRYADRLNELHMKQLSVQKDIENLETGLTELNRRGEDSTGKRKDLGRQLAELMEKRNTSEAEISALNGKIKTYREKSEKLGEEVQSQMDRRNALEQYSAELRRSTRQISDRKEKLTAEIARLEERLLTVQKEYDTIINKMWEEYELTRSEAELTAVEIADIQAAEKELQSLRGKIRALGSVNVAAIEEYKEVAGRYEFLSAQLSDVEKSKAELLRLIEDLTDTMRDIFAESFAQINEHFQRIFVDLFGGGQATLKLTEPDNVLESGIEIFVEPPGKIIKNLTLLSGGEQAFVAIAIYFAILNVRPAPFCVLDEIEAALDDINVTRYAEYLRLMSSNTQFIMITHRRGTMEEADVLYGVTMQEEGVSKLLKLNVSEVESKLGTLEG